MCLFSLFCIQDGFLKNSKFYICKSLEILGECMAGACYLSLSGEKILHNICVNSYFHILASLVGNRCGSRKGNLRLNLWAMLLLFGKRGIHL